jgi:hypothetical protein
VPVPVAGVGPFRADCLYWAPQIASASADISVLMNVDSIWRIRSGDASASWSCRNRAGSILDGVVIAWISFRSLW